MILDESNVMHEALKMFVCASQNTSIQVTDFWEFRRISFRQPFPSSDLHARRTGVFVGWLRGVFDSNFKSKLKRIQKEINEKAQIFLIIPWKRCTNVIICTEEELCEQNDYCTWANLSASTSAEDLSMSKTLIHHSLSWRRLFKVIVKKEM